MVNRIRKKMCGVKERRKGEEEVVRSEDGRRKKESENRPTRILTKNKNK